jgi:hypothetical protein
MSTKFVCNPIRFDIEYHDSAIKLCSVNDQTLLERLAQRRWITDDSYPTRCQKITLSVEAYAGGVSGPYTVSDHFYTEPQSILSLPIRESG